MLTDIRWIFHNYSAVDLVFIKHCFSKLFHFNQEIIDSSSSYFFQLKKSLAMKVSRSTLSLRGNPS